MPRQPPAAARRRAQDDRDTVMSEKPRRATIKDVAAAAGVATSTVSHTFSGHRAISAATRQRVLRAAEELGYHANPHAQSMRTGRTGMIGLILRPHLIRESALEIHESFNRVAGAIAVACLRDGVGLVHIPVDKDQLMSSLPMDGCIVAYPQANDPLIDELISRRIPLVSVDPDPARTGIAPWVGVDHEAGVSDVLRSLTLQEEDRMWLIVGTEQNAWTLASERVAVAWAESQRLDLTIYRTARGVLAGEAYEQLRDLLHWNQPPRAIVFGRSELTEAVVSAVSDFGLRVPEDIQLAALTDSAHARIPRLPVTAMDLNQEKLAEAAVMQMRRVLENPGAHPEPVIVNPILRVRESTRVEPWAAS